MTNLKDKLSKTVFGEMLTSELSPTLQIANQYGLDPTLRDDLETFTATGGSADSSVNMFRCQSGTSVGGYGVIRTARTLRYRPGEGAMARVTSTFTTGVALSLQFAGLFSLTETMAFGYDGESFSVIHEYNGVSETQSIQITNTATSGAGNITVTIDGDAVVVAITNSTVQTNAFEVYTALQADGTVSAKWRFEQIDDTVFMISQSVGDKSGTFSFVDTGTTGATATYTELQAGAAKTSGNVAQASWDKQPFAGFDPTKLNLYEVRYGYLGVANLEFLIYNPSSAQFELVHSIKWASVNTTPNFGNPDMKVGWIAASLGSSGTNLSVTGGSGMAGIQGTEVIQEDAKATFSSVGSVGTSFVNIVTVQNRILYGSKFNLGLVEPVSVSIENDHNKGLIVEVIKSPTIGGTQNYQYFNEVNSIVAIDKAGTTITNGSVIDAFTVAAGAAREINLEKLNIFLLPEETLTIAARTVSGTATTVTGTIAWKEEK
jgi:hypothetical protein